MEGTMTATPRLTKSLTQVNTSDAAVPMSGGSATQSDGQIAPLADGGYVVVWTDFSRTHNPAGAAVIGQRYDSAGNKVGGEVKLSAFNSGDQSTPSVTLLDNGNIAVAFRDLFAGDDDIWVRIFNSSLTVVRVDHVDVLANETHHPSITALAGGSYAVSYTFETGADADIVGRIVSPTGTVGAQFDIDNQSDSRDRPELATLSNGNFVAVYEDQVGGSETNEDIRFAIVSPAGTVLTGPITLIGANGPGLETDPDVAALRDGGFVFVWTDADSSVTDIRASLLNSNGAPLVSDFFVNTTTTGAQDEASVVALADGGFLVTWEDDNANLVRAQRFDAAGTKIGTEFTVKNGKSDADSPEAALLTDGGRIAYALGDISTGDDDVMTSIWRARDVSHDFDGDGKSGVLWRHDSGQVYFWEMDGLAIKAEGGVAHAPVPNDWHVQGVGDFDADGKSDILWRHDSGQVYFWEMDGLQIKAEGGVAHAPVPNDWHIQDIGDFNGDGKSDILWRHDSGQVYLWEMNGLQITAEGAVSHAPVPSDWHIFSQHNFV
jgi:hypothetical protein